MQLKVQYYQQGKTTKLVESAVPFLRAVIYAKESSSLIRGFMLILLLTIALLQSVLDRFLDIKQNGQMVMLLVGDKSWPVKFRNYPHSSSVAFTSGWSTFVKDNSLQVGDVCAFELIKSDGAMLKVSIFRNLG